MTENDVIPLYPDAYGALQTSAVVFDRSARGRLELLGARAAEMVAGLVTNDVQSLLPGQGCYAAALTAKGKIIADVRVFVTEAGVLTDSGPLAAEGWAGTVRKYVNPRLAPHRDLTSTMRMVGVYGSTAHHVVEKITGVAGTGLGVLLPYAHVEGTFEDSAVRVIRSVDLGVQGFDILVEAAHENALRDAALDAGAVAGDAELWTVARVEAGRPAWGIDMTDETLAQEANFDELDGISYTKGCYVGQETVARVHFRGRVNRHLRGVHLHEGTSLATGATLHDEVGLQVGDVRSVAQSPRFGWIGIAMVRREVEPGSQLVVRLGEDALGTVDISVIPAPAVS